MKVALQRKEELDPLVNWGETNEKESLEMTKWRMLMTKLLQTQTLTGAARTEFV